MYIYMYMYMYMCMYMLRVRLHTAGESDIYDCLVGWCFCFRQ